MFLIVTNSLDWFTMGDKTPGFLNSFGVDQLLE